MSARTGLKIAAIGLLFTACTDRVPSTGPETDPPIEPPALARLLATVDTRAGTMTFEPIASARRIRKGVNAAVYGNQGVTVRIYNGPVTVTPVAGTGRERYSGDVGIRNLLDHSIGDEQAGDAAHNLGIYVFVTNGPTVTGTSSPCTPACTVSVANYAGIRQFTAPGQRYWFWPEQLAPAGQPGDTTTNRVTWTFEADTQVTAFQFEVLVSAAWPPPAETRWAVTYNGDSVPNGVSEPRWFRNNLAGQVNTSCCNPFGEITVTTFTGGSLIYLRTDSITSSMDAYMEARVRISPAPSLPIGPEISFGLDDRTRFIAVGLSGSAVGFLSGTLTFAQSTGAPTTVYHAYQLRKYAADSVVLYVDGVRTMARAYNQFPTPLPQATNFGFYFGPLGTAPNMNSVQGNISVWDYVIYEIGVPQP